MASNEGTATAAAAMALVPSQAMSSRNRPRKKKNNANHKQNNPQQQSDHKQQVGPQPTPQADSASDAPGGDAKASGRRQQKPRWNNNRRRNNNNNNRNNKKGGDPKQLPHQEGEKPDQQQAPNANQQQNRRKRKPRKRYPWRRHIPAGTVDPITLEALASLEYPPFAIVNSPPYEPVKVWPVPDEQVEKQAEKVDLEELNKRRIEEQWGGKPIVMDTEPSTDGVGADGQESRRHYNLYDGRALAYYLVSQLQFIDPLNRRDLTRDELVNLDDYLKRHGFTDIRVTEAYDAKGITISTAGAAAITSQGRAEILQQMAQVLLNSLFGGHGEHPPYPVQNPTSEAGPVSVAPSSALQDQYAELQRREQMLAQQRHDRLQHNEFTPHDGGFYASEDGGLVIIDDDDNPGLRGGGVSRHTTTGPSSGFSGAGSLYSATHITDRYGHGNAPQTASFPALPSRPAASVSPNTTAENAPAKAKAPAKPSKTLARITGAIKKTDPVEVQRQWEAREEARKRAMMANLSFGENPSAALLTMQNTSQPGTTSVTAGSGVASAPPSEGQIQRNRVLAEALGVAPATTRQYNSGWARPAGGKVDMDEFGNELNAALYPDRLIMQARERMGLVEKIEKKWKSFLADDSSASMPLNPMDRPSRTFVHEYSDFWNLRTESFDPEPRRYIHCVKMLDTRTPHPLLSDAARNWRGPRLQPHVTTVIAATTVSDHTTQQTAGQSASSREIPPPPDRVPLPLKPRSVVASLGGGLPVVAGKTDKDIRAVDIQNGRDITPPNSRFDSLFTGRARPKLELTKRTVPLVSIQFFV